jgi:hypothetical protein
MSSSLPLGFTFDFGDSTPFGETIVATVEVWAGDLIELNFGSQMANNAALQDAASYTILSDGLVPGSISALQVQQVLAGNFSNPSSIFLVVSPFTIGERYTVTVDSACVDITGVSINFSANYAKFYGRRTKIDSVLENRPNLYDIGSTAELRYVLNALIRSDDHIGGSRLDYIEPNTLVDAAQSGVRLTPLAVTAPAGSKVQFFANTYGGLSPATVTWQVNGVTGGAAPTGTISVTGLYTAPNTVPGTPTVTITAVSVADVTKTASTVVTIVAAVLDHVAVTPANAAIAIGGDQLMTATAVYTDGSTLDVTATAIWFSYDAAIAIFTSPVNKAHGTGTGSVVLSASYTGVNGTTRLNVS